MDIDVPGYVGKFIATVDEQKQCPPREIDSCDACRCPTNYCFQCNVEKGNVETDGTPTTQDPPSKEGDPTHHNVVDPLSAAQRKEARASDRKAARREEKRVDARTADRKAARDAEQAAKAAATASYDQAESHVDKVAKKTAKKADAAARRKADRFNAKQAAKNGKQALSATASTTDCNICKGFSDSTCLSALEIVVGGMNDKSRLKIEEQMLDPEGTVCSGKSDKDCLATLDESFDALGDADKLTLLDEMCDMLSSPEAVSLGQHTKKSELKSVRNSLKNEVMGGKSKSSLPPKTTTTASSSSTTTTSSCAACDGLSDKACLSSLDASFTALSDKNRLAYARSTLFTDADTTCESLSDKACLIALDSEYAALTDKAKLSLLKAACAASPISTAATMLRLDASSAATSEDTTLENVESPSPPRSSKKAASSSSLLPYAALGFVVGVMATGLIAWASSVLRHRVHRYESGYEPIPGDPSEDFVEGAETVEISL